MAIHRRHYEPWEGERTPAHLRWMPLFFRDLGRFVRRKGKALVGLFALVFFTGAPYLWALALVYLHSQMGNLSEDWLQLAKQLPEVDAKLMLLLMTNGWTLFWGMVLLVWSASSLIAAERRHRTMEVTLAHPVSRKGFLFAKTAVPLLLMLSVQVIPPLLVILAKWTMGDHTGSLGQDIRVLVLAPILFLLFWLPQILCVLALSTLTQWTRFAGIAYVVLYFMSSIMGVVFTALGVSAGSLFRPQFLASQAGALLLGMPEGKFSPIAPEFSYAYGWAAVILLVSWGLLWGFVLWRRTKPVEWMG